MLRFSEDERRQRDAPHNIAAHAHAESNRHSFQTRSRAYYVISQVNERKAVRSGQEIHLENLALESREAAPARRVQRRGTRKLVNEVTGCGTQLAGQTAHSG